MINKILMCLVRALWLPVIFAATSGPVVYLCSIGESKWAVAYILFLGSGVVGWNSLQLGEKLLK
jgi:hypothetical protein